MALCCLKKSWLFWEAVYLTVKLKISICKQIYVICSYDNIKANGKILVSIIAKRKKIEKYKIKYIIWNNFHWIWNRQTEFKSWPVGLSSISTNSFAHNMDLFLPTVGIGSSLKERMIWNLDTERGKLHYISVGIMEIHRYWNETQWTPTSIRDI